MLGRRFLVIVAVLMGLTALAASVAPRQQRARAGGHGVGSRGRPAARPDGLRRAEHGGALPHPRRRGRRAPDRAGRVRAPDRNARDPLAARGLGVVLALVAAAALAPRA